MRGVSSMFPGMSLWVDFGLHSLVPSPDDLVINLTAISILKITSLSIAMKIAPWTLLLLAAKTHSTSFLTLSAKFP